MLTSLSNTATTPLPENDERFKKLIERLPKEIITDLFNYKISDKILNEKLSELIGWKIFKKEKKLVEISKMAIYAYRVQKINFEELATIFMHIGAMEELYLNQKYALQIIDDNLKDHCFFSYVMQANPSFSPFIPEEFITTGFLATQRFMLRAQKLPEEYINKIKKQDKLDIPFIKNFYRFTNSEWDEFSSEMSKASLKERKFTFLNLPNAGAWSPLYEHIIKSVRCFRITKYLQGDISLASPPVKINYLLLPSFTMMQTALKVKAMTKQRKPMSLSPHFSSHSFDDLYTLKKEDKSPFGLYCPTAQGMDPKVTIKHMRIVDGHAASGPLSFLIHDVYHALRWQEMNENIAKAVLYSVDILDSFSKSLDKNSSEYKELRSGRNSLIDGELVFSYPYDENSFFKSRPYQTESFGNIFDHVNFPNDLKNRILLDFAVKYEFWLNNFKIDYSSFKEQDQVTAYLLKLFYQQTAPNPLFDTYILNENKPQINFSGQQVQIINSNIGKLVCGAAMIQKSIFSSIQALRGVVIGHCNLEGVTLETPLAHVAGGKVKSITSNGQIYFQHMVTTNCSNIKAPVITWEIDQNANYEKFLKLDGFDCEELIIKGYDNQEIQLINSKIGRIHFVKNTRNDCLNLIGHTPIYLINTKECPIVCSYPIEDNKIMVLNMVVN